LFDTLRSILSTSVRPLSGPRRPRRATSSSPRSSGELGHVVPLVGHLRCDGHLLFVGGSLGVVALQVALRRDITLDSGSVVLTFSLSPALSSGASGLLRRSVLPRRSSSARRSARWASCAWRSAARSLSRSSLAALSGRLRSARPRRTAGGSSPRASRTLCPRRRRSPWHRRTSHRPRDRWCPSRDSPTSTRGRPSSSRRARPDRHSSSRPGAQPQRGGEDGPKGVLVASSEPCDGRMVGKEPRTDHPEPDVDTAGSLDLPRAANTEAVRGDEESHDGLRMRRCATPAVLAVRRHEGGEVHRLTQSRTHHARWS
jgi:hypothetical protein